ncbi:MAG: flagellar hook-associated protein FlgK [Burkholderiales bacterium]|nr:flagellar hook-associated protein FlgK [Burkholderiales bacterium]MDE2075475.1 flagellar hook-associated protein FlgK [Burkholderiales bacterium]MDE2432613.1 flagellar hook-associated protein FlgK [Burkholderiales bacterium]
MASSIFSISTRAMMANTSQLQTLSHNISNANTPGYSRQSVELATEGGQFTGAGFFGQGVRVQTVSRANDPFLTREANSNLSASSSDKTRLDKLQQLEKAFQTGTSGIGYASSQMLNAFVDVANQPQDLSARQVVLARAQDLVSRVQTAGNQLSTIQAGIMADMKTTVSQINDYAKQIADVNQKIAVAQGSGQSPNDLLDTRDELIKQLNTKVQVSTVAAGDGTISVFMGGGQRLVLGNSAEQLNVEVDDFDATKGRLSVITPTGNLRLDDSAITGGSLKGLFQAQDNDIPAAQNQLGQMASAISWRVNQQQSLGLDLGTPAGSGKDIFSVGPPTVLPSRYNGSSLSTPPVSITVLDGRELQASDYRMENDPANPGAYRITRLSDNKVFSNVTNGTKLDGMQINITGATAPGDQFMLRPVGNAGINMTRVLDKPSGIAAASPVTGTVNAANTGTASINSLTVSATNTVPYGNVQIQFTDNVGNYTLTDPTSGASVTGTWKAGTPISYNGWNLNLNGVPSQNDTITVAPTQFPSSNNGNALSILGIRDEDIVGRQRTVGASGSVVTPGANITTAYSQLIGNIGVTVQSAKTSADISSKLSSDTQTLLQNENGVNLDEEAAKMIQYQQSYQASAKVLQVAHSVFQTLLGVLG